MYCTSKYLLLDHNLICYLQLSVDLFSFELFSILFKAVHILNLDINFIANDLFTSVVCIFYLGIDCLTFFYSLIMYN